MPIIAFLSIFKHAINAKLISAQNLIFGKHDQKVNDIC
jgi:hypothetical protein